jgi:hypothetical protein
MKRILLLVVTLALSSPTLANDEPLMLINTSCQTWLMIHTSNNPYGTGLQDGYLLFFVDEQRYKAGRPMLNYSQYTPFIRAVSLYCYRQPSDTVTSAAGYVDASFAANGQ